ncbi:MAG: tetratricopeptide repeat protein [Rickettsiaceae bacterium]|nr:tetratricopeptide repeat protein [Rickettsiaceae bacterium]
MSKEQKEKEASLLNEKALSLVFYKKYDEKAISFFKQAIALVPDNPLYHTNLAKAYYCKGDSEEALYWVEQALENNKNYEYALKIKEDINKDKALSLGKKADAFYKLKIYDEAVDLYLQAIKLDPENSVYKARLAWNYCLKGDNKTAWDFANKALQLDKNNHRAKITKAKVLNSEAVKLYNDRKYHESIKLYQEAIKFDPGNVKYHTNIAWNYFYMKEYNDAWTHTEIAWELNPKILDVQHIRVRMLNLQAKNLYNPVYYKDVLKKYYEILDIMPCNSETHYNVARTLLKLRKYEKGLNYIKKSIALSDNNLIEKQKIQKQIISCYIKKLYKTNHDKCIYLSKELIELDPNNLDAYFYMAKGYIAKGYIVKSDLAQDYMTKLILYANKIFDNFYTPNSQDNSDNNDKVFHCQNFVLQILKEQNIINGNFNIIINLKALSKIIEINGKKIAALTPYLENLKSITETIYKEVIIPLRDVDDLAHTIIRYVLEQDILNTLLEKHDITVLTINQITDNISSVSDEDDNLSLIGNYHNQNDELIIID